jgi:hypothetical protein
MRLDRRPPWPAAILTLLLLAACDKSPTPAEPAADAKQAAAAASVSSAAPSPFEEAQVFFELNTTDHDMGFQVFLDAEGWRRVSLFDPDGNRVFGIQADGKLAEIGITELRFESEEPSPPEVRSRFPAGQYTFRGETVEGATLVSEVNLSQRMLDAPSFTPRNGQVVDPQNTVVRWQTPGAEQVEVIIENDELGHVLDVTLSASTDRLTIPRQFLKRGREYKIEILAIAENGNRTIAESTFRTEG